jgi:hypothetical protein
LALRVLHLIESAAAQANCATLAMFHDAYGRLGEIEQHAVLLGGDTLSATVVNAGVKLEDVTCIHTPGGSALAGYFALKSHLRREGLDTRSGSQSFDVIHCWSPRALMLAAVTFRQTPKLLTLTTTLTKREAKLVRVLTGGVAGRVHVLALSNAIMRTLAQEGIDLSHVSVLRPAIDMSRVDSSARDSVRKSWGIHDDNAKVVALLSDPPTAVSAVHGVYISLNFSYSKSVDAVKLLVHPRQRDLHKARQMLGRQGMDNILIEDADVDQPWRVLPGCDVAMALGQEGAPIASSPTGRIHATERPADVHGRVDAFGTDASVEGGGGGLSLLWAMASNVPIVGEATYGISEIVEDRHSALLSKPGHALATVQRIESVLMDPKRHWELRDTARHEAYSFFSRSRYCDALRGVYESVQAGSAIEIPEIEATGGLRFSGRA